MRAHLGFALAARVKAALEILTLVDEELSNYLDSDSWELTSVDTSCEVYEDEMQHC